VKIPTNFTFRIDTWTADGESTSPASRTIRLHSPPTGPPAYDGPAHPITSRQGARVLSPPQWTASATWAGCATALYSPWLNQICKRACEYW
jgi:hypothetical protein